jgi:threonine/homoserine/homoserine lactone efflux protein
VLLFLLIGIAAGAATGVPIGPVNVAVIDAAYRHTLRRAIATGLGGGVADMLYAGLGVLGVTPLLNNYPSVPPILYAVSGVVLLVYGFLTARSQPVQPAVTPSAEGERTPSSVKLEMRRDMWQGFSVGAALILLNPAAMVTWVVIIGQLIPEIESTWDGLACAFGVFVGSFAWFTLVAYLTQKGKNVLGEKAAWIPRVIGVALMVYAVYLLAKAVNYVVA